MMEYMVTINQPFQDVEAQIVGALEQQGFVVQRTFSLGPVTVRSKGDTERDLGYDVLMLYMSGAQSRPLGMITLYARGGQLVIHPTLTSQAKEDDSAELVAALILGGLDFCVSTVAGTDCIDPRQDSRSGQAVSGT